MALAHGGEALLQHQERRAVQASQRTHPRASTSALIIVIIPIAINAPAGAIPNQRYWILNTFPAANAGDRCAQFVTGPTAGHGIRAQPPT